VNAAPIGLRRPSLVDAVEAHWPAQTGSEITPNAGNSAGLEAALQKRYGRSREQATAEIDNRLTRGGDAFAATAPAFASRATA
jgi:hypothetical protein